VRKILPAEMRRAAFDEPGCALMRIRGPHSVRQLDGMQTGLESALGELGITLHESNRDMTLLDRGDAQVLGALPHALHVGTCPIAHHTA